MGKSTMFSRSVVASSQLREYISPSVEVIEVLYESGMATSVTIGGDTGSQINDIPEWSGWE